MTHAIAATDAVLVTGCAGFIGAATARALLEQGRTVVGIDNLNEYYDVRLKRHRLVALTAYPRFSFRPLDVEDRAAVEELIAGPPIRTVINLAARAGVRHSLQDPHVYLRTNAMGHLHLLDALRRFSGGASKLVLASTSSLYAGHAMPFTEDQPVNCPVSPYAASKKAAEVMSYSYSHLFGLDVSVLRYFTVYGPAGRPDMSIFRFVQSIDLGRPIRVYGDGRQRRDFTYLDDIVAGTIAALRPLGFEIINLGGGGMPVLLLDVIALIEKLLGKKAQIIFEPSHPGDMYETQADISKARRLLDWRPHTSLETGLDACIRWYRDHLPWSATIGG